jgi:hypothetical protein
MKPVANAVVEAGLVPEEVLDEMARWGVHITAVPKENILQSPQAVVEHIRRAYESEEQVRIDETDLDLLSRYLDQKHQKSGRLILKDGKQHKTVNVSFCLTELGEYAIPWTEPETPDILFNGETHLKWQDGEEQRDVYFEDVRELSFGSRKAFAVCTPLVRGGGDDE